MPQALDEGSLHGKYRLGDQISQGGFGVTWRAYDVTLHRPVCVKQFFDTDPERTQAYLREARSLAQFSDPGIVQVFEAFVEDGEAYLVTELLAGEDLSDYVAETGPLSLDDTLLLLSPVCEALERIHEAGLVHRDVSPTNIRVLPSGEGEAAHTTKLMDFGSTVLSTRGDPTRTVAVRPHGDGVPPAGVRPDPPARPGVATAEPAMRTTLVVRPGYSPPEQYRTTRLTPAADVFSLAATIWYCLTGCNPSTEDAEEGSAVTAPSKVRPGCVDARRERVLMSALASEASKRPASVRELCEGLQGDGPAPTPARRRRRWGRVARRVTIAVACAGVALGVTLALRSLLPGVRMPNVVGFTQDRAVETLEEQGISVARVTEEYSDQREGTVIDQDPTAGAYVPDGGVGLVVSEGPRETVTVPNVIGLSEDKARRAIERVGLVVGGVTSAASVDYPASQVCRQDPAANAEVEAGSVVDLTISTGTPEIVTSLTD